MLEAPENKYLFRLFLMWYAFAAFAIIIPDGVAADDEIAGLTNRPYHAYALVIGSNRAGINQQPLRYAHRDANNVASVLQQIGGYPARQVELLIDPSTDTILDRLDSLGKQIARHARDEEPSTLFFYYSGHARVQSLTLGEDELRLSQMRGALSAIPADAKIVVLDACQTGAYSRIKGASLEADFSYNSIAMLQTSGTAVMASSAADEFSQESDALKGSFFTHHLVVGMRGAADSDKDGRISLFEAYEYAYNHTLIATAGTSVGAQHVTLETELKGKGEMILSWPENAQARLQLPKALEAKVIVYDTDTYQVQAEILKTEGADVVLAFPVGNYAAILNQKDGQYRCPFTLAQDQTTALDLSSCTPFEATLVTVKSEGRSGEGEEPEADALDTAAKADAVPGADTKSETEIGAEQQKPVTLEKAVPVEKKKTFIWSPFLEVSLGMMFNDKEDGYSQALHSLQYHPVDNLKYHFHWSVVAGVSITRYIGLAFLFSSLDSYSYKLNEYDQYSGDQLSASTSWSSFRLGGQLRGSYPLFRDWVTPFISFGLGPSGIKKETSSQSSFSDFEAGSYESIGAPSMSMNEFEWHLSMFGGLGLSVKVYRILQLVAQGEYIYTPGLENNGGVHNHGGWSITNGIRCSL